LEQLDLITTNLQNAVMKLRMVHVKEVFDRFPRLVRDLSQSKNKKVNLVTEGEETELDRTITNVIGEPLTHLIKNAIDHGIERAADRKRLNKREKGRIKLSARHEGSHVIIEVEDDGYGIDTRIIKTKAIEKGLKTPQELDNMTEEEIVNLIFERGFSLSKEESGASHRGEGLDTVKSTIEALHGEIKVETALKKGTRVVIKLPLTLAIIKAMLVKISGGIYALPVESLQENIYIYPRDIKRVQNQQVMYLRDEILRLVSLKSKLGLDKGEELTDEDAPYPVIVVEAGGKRAGFLVDELLDQQEIVIKSLGKLLEGLQGIAGATVLANGEVALILDVSSLA
ncbi:MAG: chemotaxis protein CheA, partial [Candidatus Syntrophonatronum acetioxidans]